MTTAFSLHNISRRYRNRELLRVDDMQVGGGKIYGILGPNGSGKTTLLKTMALLIHPDNGQLELWGEKIDWGRSQILRLRRQMAMVTQTPYMFSGSVFYNVAYGLKIRKTPAAEVRRTVQECLEFFKMQDFAQASASNLSGGERQKTALARALAIRPKVLFLDEPTSNVDPSSAKEIEEYIRYINREYGTTIILVTHNLFQARRLVDEIFFFWDGHLIETGSVEEVFAHPGDQRCAGFLKGETVF